MVMTWNDAVWIFGVIALVVGFVIYVGLNRTIGTLISGTGALSLVVYLALWLKSRSKNQANQED